MDPRNLFHFYFSRFSLQTVSSLRLRNLRISKDARADANLLFKCEHKPVNTFAIIYLSPTFKNSRRLNFNNKLDLRITTKMV